MNLLIPTAPVHDREVSIELILGLPPDMLYDPHLLRKQSVSGSLSVGYL